MESSELVPLAVRQALREKELVCSAQEIEYMVDQMAVRMTLALQDQAPIFVVVQHGGAVIAGMLARRLGFPCQWGYVHASRYGQATKGGELNWIAVDTPPLSNATVVLIDDIADEGITLSSLVQWAVEQGAKQVQSAVLVKRKDKGQHAPDYIGLEVDEGFLIGCGMDVQGYGRNLNAIYRVPS